MFIKYERNEELKPQVTDWRVKIIPHGIQLIDGGNMKAKGLAFLVITGKFKLLSSTIQNKIMNNAM